MQQRFHCHVEQMQPLTSSIIKLVLSPPLDFSHQAGQYIELFSATGSAFYSIANAPLANGQLEIHIRHHHGNAFVETTLQALSVEGTVEISTAFGQCYADKLNMAQPILLIAAGTGFSPVKAIIEALLEKPVVKPIGLLRLVKKTDDLYLPELPKAWQEQTTLFHTIADVGGMLTGEHVMTLVRQHFLLTAVTQVVLGGPFQMAYDFKDLFLAQGFQGSQLFSDAFEFSQ